MGRNRIICYKSNGDNIEIRIIFEALHFDHLILGPVIVVYRRHCVVYDIPGIPLRLHNIIFSSLKIPEILSGFVPRVRDLLP